MKNLKNSVEKTFAILEYFTNQKPEWGTTELALEIGSNKSTVYRFLSDLQKQGILYKNPVTDKYSLGLKLFELGNRVRLRSAFVEKTHPILIELSNNITETVHIAILKSQQVFYIDKVESPQGLTLSSQIGSFNPANATALGKVLLAYLPEEERQLILQSISEKHNDQAYTRNTITDPAQFNKELMAIKQNGYAIDREEFEIGLICVAIPIFNQADEVVASLSASGPASRFNEDEVMNYVQILRTGANRIKSAIGYFKPTVV